MGRFAAPPSWVEPATSLHELDLRERTVQVLDAAAALGMGPARRLLDDLRFVWTRERRWRRRAPATTVVHVAGEVIACREWRGYYRRIVCRRQACQRCGRQLVFQEGPSGTMIWFEPGSEVAEHSGILNPASGDPLEQPCRGAAPTEEEAPGVRVVAYLRVSTARQANDGFGLEVQREAITNWARERRHKVVEWCTDAGRSGADDVLDRPGLGAALQRIAAGQAAGVVVARLDRLARDLIIQEQVLAEVTRLRGRIHSAVPGEDDLLADEPDDHTRKLVRQVLGAVAEHERGVIRLRMRAGKAAKLAAGGYAHGRPPYGLRAAGRALVVDPDEQCVVDLISELRAAGRSYRAICTELHERGHTTRAGNQWSPSAAAAVVARTRKL